MLKVILDTSVFCSALKSKSRESIAVKLLLEWQQGWFKLVMAPQLLEELARKLIEVNVPTQDVIDLVAAINVLAHAIPGIYETSFLDEVDPKDNMFLAASYEAKVDYLVSRDNDLLSQKYFHGTQIVDPPIFLSVLNRQKTTIKNDV